MTARPLPPLPVIIEAMLTDMVSAGHVGELTDLLQATWLDGARYGQMDEAGRKEHREERKRLAAEFEAILASTPDEAEQDRKITEWLAPE